MRGAFLHLLFDLQSPGSTDASHCTLLQLLEVAQVWCRVRNQLNYHGEAEGLWIAEGYSMSEPGARSALVQGDVQGKDVDTNLITGVGKF